MLVVIRPVWWLQQWLYDVAKVREPCDFLQLCFQEYLMVMLQNKKIKFMIKYNLVF